MGGQGRGVMSHANIGAKIGKNFDMDSISVNFGQPFYTKNRAGLIWPRRYFKTLSKNQYLNKLITPKPHNLKIIKVHDVQGQPL